MYWRIIRNDISRSKLIALTIAIFVAAAAMLVSLAAILSVNLAGSIGALMNKAQTPHFMQMHTGEVDHARLTEFVNRNNDIDKFQVLEFLNIDGAQIILGNQSLADSVQDNGFSVQSEKFDYLLDLDGHIINASDGELYVPISYMKDAKAGDKAWISGKELTVAGFVRDSQMNSMLSSSKRFVVSANDYAEIQHLGHVEYLIEFRLKDLASLGAFETAYAAAALEANGPAITYPLFKMINAISDGIMIAVLLIVSSLVVAISFLCIRFTLLAKIEDDYREIGVMKAIGLRVSDIKKIYLAQYAAIAAVGCLLGFALSLVFQDLLLENIRLYMGESGHFSSALLLATVGILLVFLVTIAYVNGVLRRFRNISAAEAIRLGVSQEKTASGKRFTLSGNRLLPIPIFLGVKDVFARKKLYATMLAVLTISVFIIIVPQNLHHTISSKSFIQYMGIGNYDLRMDIQQTDHMSEKAAEILRSLDSDSAISEYAVYATKTFRVKAEAAEEKNIKVELGDHSIFPIAYEAGQAPVEEHEIALSVINADEFGKKPGDTMTLFIEGQERQLVVSGIYSDITNGGKTAKAAFADHSADSMWMMVGAKLADPSLIDAKSAEYTDTFAYAKVSDMKQFIAQTFGSTINAVAKASYASISVAIMISLLVTLLFMKLLVVKDKYSIAVMKAFGFTHRDIKAQYVSRSIFVLAIAIILGTLLSNTLGELLAGALISSFGASTFQFAANPLAAYLISPLMVAGAVLFATMIGVSGAGLIKISEHIKE